VKVKPGGCLETKKEKHLSFLFRKKKGVAFFLSFLSQRKEKFGRIEA
jgi:hypothetical protein